MQFTRQAAPVDERPRSMTFLPSTGLAIIDWSRDGDQTARFQYRPELPDEPARVRLDHPDIRWEVVPVGAVITREEGDILTLTIPQVVDSPRFPEDFTGRAPDRQPPPPGL